MAGYIFSLGKDNAQEILKNCNLYNWGNKKKTSKRRNRGSYSNDRVCLYNTIICICNDEWYRAYHKLENRN